VQISFRLCLDPDRERSWCETREAFDADVRIWCATFVRASFSRLVARI
jgi:hypothetical protein